MLALQPRQIDQNASICELPARSRPQASSAYPGRVSASPLPQRLGLDAARIRTPAAGEWPTLRDHLVHRLTHRVTAERIDGQFDSGGYVDDAGRPLTRDSVFVPGMRIWFHRDLPDEEPVPFEVGVLHADERIVVADKPHFLATIPRGQHIRQTALIRLREELGLPELSPAHRLDLATAGVLLFTTRQEFRGRYQNIFRDRLARKTYLAVAGVRPDLTFPLTVRSHIVKEPGSIQATDTDDLPPNAETIIDLVAVRGDRGLYRLTPSTGRTHQLRLHLWRLGLPIEGDGLYPTVLDTDGGDFSTPLQLLAESLEFDDPIDGTTRRFVSARTLDRWPSRRSGRYTPDRRGRTDD